MRYSLHWYFDPVAQQLVAIDLAKSAQEFASTTFNLYNRKLETSLGQYDLYIGGKTQSRYLYVSLVPSGEGEEFCYSVKRTSLRPFETCREGEEMHRINLAMCS